MRAQCNEGVISCAIGSAGVRCDLFAVVAVGKAFSTEPPTCVNAEG
jgi:hypothetical protein